LLAKDFNPDDALAISTDYFMNQEGCALLNDQHVFYYHWKNKVGRDVEPITGEASPNLQHAAARYRAYYTLQRWQMYKVASQQNSQP